MIFPHHVFVNSAILKDAHERERAERIARDAERLQRHRKGGNWV
jgi:hypothetical protein